MDLVTYCGLEGLICDILEVDENIVVGSKDCRLKRFGRHLHITEMTDHYIVLPRRLQTIQQTFVYLRSFTIHNIKRTVFNPSPLNKHCTVFPFKLSTVVKKSGILSLLL